MLVEHRRCSKNSERSVMFVFTVICVRGEGVTYTPTHTLTHLVLPLKLRPHLAKLSISTSSRLNVVHNVNVYVVQHDHIPVRSGSDDVVNWNGNRDTWNEERENEN